MIKSPLSNIVQVVVPKDNLIIVKEPDGQPVSHKKSNLSINHLDFHSLVRSPSSVPKNQAVVLSSGKTLIAPFNGLLQGDHQANPTIFNQKDEENDVELP